MLRFLGLNLHKGRGSRKGGAMFLTIGVNFILSGWAGKKLTAKGGKGWGSNSYDCPKGHGDRASARARRRDGRRAGCLLAWHTRRQYRQARLKGKIGSGQKAAKWVDGKRVGDETADGVGAGDASGRGEQRKRAPGQRPLPMQRRRIYSA